MQYRLRTLLIVARIILNRPIMIRFTIRDVLWLTALVALALRCGFAREKYLAASGVWK